MTFITSFPKPISSHHAAEEPEVFILPPGSSAAAPSWEEQDRERAARAFVNFATDQAIRMSLGSLCKAKTCSACGIDFLAMSEKDELCHCCISAPWVGR